PILERLDAMFTELAEELKAGSARRRPTAASEPPAVVVKSESWVDQLPAYLGSTLEWLGGPALVLVLVVFIFLKCEDMRNRVVRLAGERRLSFTTRAMVEAGERISRYLFVQLLINGAFGLTLGLGLLAIGVHHALLWGLLGAVLRYMPYVGPWIAALF